MPYLTKTRFKEAIECPDRMFYYGRKDYADSRKSDEFLRELAKNGIQVGELAKCYYPGGVEIASLNSDEAVAETEHFLKQENVILYEAALRVGNLLVRVDVLIKKGKSIELIEVKSKSFRTTDEFYTTKGELTADWKLYFYDIAFQVFVGRKALPGYSIYGSLSLIDKTKKCTVDNLFQKFRLKSDSGRYTVVVNPNIDVGQPILTKVDIRDSVEKILNGREVFNGDDLAFDDYVSKLEQLALNETLITGPTGRHCRSCPYQLTGADADKGLKSGFVECWSKKEKFSQEHFVRPSVFDVWNLNYRKLDGFLSEKRFFMGDLRKDDLQPKKKSASTQKELPIPERQWLQIERALNPELQPFVDKAGLNAVFSELTYPLHFIDFEVTMNAIPYRAGLLPYYRMAFQFSHHTLDEKGNVAHAGQWLETSQGNDPNINFVRKLKGQLDSDRGSILTYSSYENAILVHLHGVISSSQVEDKAELLRFIESITTENRWQNSRPMIDMRIWVLNYYLSKHMANSNSIKFVLPSIIEDSAFVNKKYSGEVYGSAALPSSNFKDKAWIKKEHGKLINPYKLLPPIFDGLDRSQIELLFDDEELADGGAAMCAYNLMQFKDMSAEERKAIIESLYKYCELDTLAMVMVYEGLKDLAQ